MRKVSSGYLALVGFLSISAHAQEAASNEMPALTELIQDENLVRNKNDRSSDLPDGIAYSSILGLLSSIDLAAAKRIVRANMDLDETAASNLLGQLLAEHEKLNKNSRSATEEIGCAYGAPRVGSSRESYAVLEEIDDVGQVLANDYYIRFRNGLEPKLAAKLSEWIYDAKTNITHVDLDYEEVHERLGTNGFETLQALCGAYAYKGENDE